MATGAHVLEIRDQLDAIAHPTRLRILDAMREPQSAAAVARALGEPRQRVNHHVKELARAGLLESAGERRNGNFIEQLYESVGGTFVLSPRLAWTGDRRHQALADQVSLENLVEFGERLQRAATGLLDEAAFDGRTIPSATVETHIRFADADDRAAFLDDYLRLVSELVERHADADGTEYRLGLVTYPAPPEEQDS